MFCIYFYSHHFGFNFRKKSCNLCIAIMFLQCCNCAHENAASVDQISSNGVFSAHRFKSYSPRRRLYGRYRLCVTASIYHSCACAYPPHALCSGVCVFASFRRVWSHVSHSLWCGERSGLCRWWRRTAGSMVLESSTDVINYDRKLWQFNVLVVYYFDLQSFMSGAPHRAYSHLGIPWKRGWSGETQTKVYAAFFMISH